MKLAFIDVTASNSFGGIQTAVWQLAHELSSMGHDVHIFAGYKDGHVAPEYPGIKLHTFPFIPRHRLPSFGTRFRKFGERLSFALHARKSFIMEEFDWAILTKPFDFIWPCLVQGRSKTQFAFMSGGTDFFVGDKYLSRYIKKWLSCSHFNAWQLHDHYKIFSHVMFNGVNTTAFAPLPAKEDRATLGITEHDVVFGYAGRLVGWKGLNHAIRALALLPQELPIKLLLIGDGPSKASWQRLAHDLQLSDKVLFHPPVSHTNLPQMINIFDVGIFPSIGDEAFGISIAEAMSCGKPVIASHIGGIPEVVGNENTCGYLWSPSDPHDLAKKMLKLIQDPSLRQVMGNLARQRVIDHFTWQKSTQRLLNVLA
ncbi:MAG TPA: glycosyltransferase family 4 protein [Candidatus Nitrosotenuis sp.]|jgi:glycosyltransferase involved in cell wall biosynthesis|nr:glycosyltransferase family 4 protein [Candidatus Nitrosotenuis sp.]